MKNVDVSSELRRRFEFDDLAAAEGGWPSLGWRQRVTKLPRGIKVWCYGPLALSNGYGLAVSILGKGCLLEFVSPAGDIRRHVVCASNREVIRRLLAAGRREIHLAYYNLLDRASDLQIREFPDPSQRRGPEIVLLAERMRPKTVRPRVTRQL